jgi:fused signal recognition particle receptor
MLEEADVPDGWEPDPTDFDEPAAPAESSNADSGAEWKLRIEIPAAVPPISPARPSAGSEDASRAEPENEPKGPADDPAESAALNPAETALEVGLERTKGGFMSRLRGVLVGDAEGGPSWDDVEESLIAGDVGAALAIDLVARARLRHDPGGPVAAMRIELASLLVARDLAWRPTSAILDGPAVVLVVGVNGTGKTTTIGKLASRYRGEGRTVILAAADTFRAAAIDQLRIWADRAGVPIVAHAPGVDPGAVVYDALDAAVARGADLVIADTAGRLHTKSNLMDELSKVRRVIDKRLPGAKPETIFVLDATTGQNGLSQAIAFHEAVGLTGVILTKLDSTAKGGIIFAIEDALRVPVRFVGVGEAVGDLIPFDPDAFVAALFD